MGPAIWSEEMMGVCGKGDGCPMGDHCAGEYGTVPPEPLNVDCKGKAGVVALNAVL